MKPEEEKPPNKAREKTFLLILAAAALGVGIYFGLQWLIFRWHYVSTDDAQVKANLINLSAFSPATYQAQLAMHQLLVKAGYSPAEVMVKGKNLMGLWVQRQAAVGDLCDGFVFAALIIALGIVPALLIRKQRDLQAPEAVSYGGIRLYMTGL